MTRTSAILRLLMILLCLAPFASARQTGGAFAPFFPHIRLAPASGFPAPVEEEDERETAEAKHRLKAQSRHRAPLRSWVGNQLLKRDPLTVPQPLTHFTAPFDPDPFRNGLGCPYRC